MRRITLVLSGGAVRGAAHIGVIKALEEYGLSIDGLSGSSAGSIIAVFYGAGYPAKEMEEIILKTKVMAYLKPSFNLQGFFSLEKMGQLFEQYIGVKDISQLEKKVFVCATNLELAKPEYFDTGDITKVVSASCALPPLFEPVEINGYTYIDGGIMNNLPVEPFLDTGSFIIGSDVNPIGRGKPVKDPFNLLIRSLYLAIRSNVEMRKNYCHIFLQPPDLKGIGMFSPWKIKDAIDIGYKYAKEVLKDIKKQLKE
ncbi:MAG: patatin-like phospholipase family protein [Aquificae bacterium]|nr:patatin-like phospholipase family protein [Aquificota bacterium]